MSTQAPVTTPQPAGTAAITLPASGKTYILPGGVSISAGGGGGGTTAIPYVAVIT